MLLQCVLFHYGIVILDYSLLVYVCIAFDGGE